jgi:hypothetical protein
MRMAKKRPSEAIPHTSHHNRDHLKLYLTPAITTGTISSSTSHQPSQKGPCQALPHTSHHNRDHLKLYLTSAIKTGTIHSIPYQNKDRAPTSLSNRPKNTFSALRDICPVPTVMANEVKHIYALENKSYICHSCPVSHTRVQEKCFTCPERKDPS